MPLLTELWGEIWRRRDYKDVAPTALATASGTTRSSCFGPARPRFGFSGPWHLRARRAISRLKPCHRLLQSRGRGLDAPLPGFGVRYCSLGLRHCRLAQRGHGFIGRHCAFDSQHCFLEVRRCFGVSLRDTARGWSSDEDCDFSAAGRNFSAARLHISAARREGSAAGRIIRDAGRMNSAARREFSAGSCKRRMEGPERQWIVWTWAVTVSQSTLGASGKKMRCPPIFLLWPGPAPLWHFRPVAPARRVPFETVLSASGAASL
jgi:hypothetical protein